MKQCTYVIILSLMILATQSSFAQLRLRDDFNRTATTDLSTSAAPYKWVKLTTQPNATASLQINSDGTISPYTTAGVGNYGGVAWDSLMTDTTQIGLIVRQKGGNGVNSSFFINVRMSGKDLSTSSGYRLEYYDNTSGTDEVTLQRVVPGASAVFLATLAREIAVGDTLFIKVEANKTMKALVYGANGVRDSITATDNTYNPSTWYCWLRGAVFTTPVKMDNFIIGRIPQPAPVFSVAPGSLSFGSIFVGANKRDSVTVTNTGAVSLTISSVTSDNASFTVTPASGTLAPAASQKFYVTFAPSSSGAKSGNISFTHNAAGSPSAVPVSGTGLTADVAIAPPSLAFGNVNVGSNKLDSVTVSNTGASTLTIASVASDNANFTVTPTSGSIPVAGSQRFYITFSPSSAGAKAGNIVFTHSGAGSPTTVPVTGTGIGIPAFSVAPPSISFGNVNVSSGKTDSVTVTNPGSGTLTITSVASTNTQFTVSPTSGSIAPGGNQKFILTFTPTSTGAKTGTINFTHNAAGSPGTVAVDGNGVAPGFSATPPSIAFGPVGIGIGKPDSVIVTNTGNGTLTVSSVVSNNARFTISPTSGTVAPLASKSFVVTFTPNAAGVQSGTITFTHNATGSPSTVSVSGSGVTVPVFTSFTPPSGPIGTTVTITGANFNATAANNAVYFGAVKATVLGGNTLSLNVTVPAGATYFPITVTTNGLTVYSAVPFLVTFPSNRVIDTTSFGPRIVIPTGPQPFGVAMADFDLDGKPDIANANTSSISAIRNIATPGTLTAGSFEPALQFTTKLNSYILARGDLDGDGLLDIAVTNEGDTTVSVFRNASTGPGTFSAATFATRLDLRTGVGPQGIAIRDLDGDGKPELIVANDSAGTVSVFRNIGSPGSITAASFAPKVDFPTGPNPRFIEIGDVDGDGKPDIITPNFGGNNFSVLRNTSTSGSITATSFAAPVNIATGATPKSAAFGDYDGDGKGDVAIGNFGFNTVAVFRNLSTPGSIAFGPRVDFFTGDAPRSVVTNDMDGDGKLDLIVVNEIGLTVSILRNTSTPGVIDASTFAPAVNRSLTRPVFVAVGDLDGDGKPDILADAINDNALSIFRNQVSATPVFSVAPLALSFGSVPAGTTKRDSVTVSNTGASALVISSAVTDQARYTVTPGSGTIAPAGSMKFYVTFAPTAAGQVSGSLIFTYNGPGSPDSVALGGSGLEPTFSISARSVAFGNTQVGSSKNDSVRVTNLGTAALSITSVVSTNPKFTLSPPSATIAPSASKTFILTFSPTSAGPQSGQIIFAHNGRTSPDSVSVSGVGGSQLFVVTPQVINFGESRIGSGHLDSVTVSNPGSSPLTISSVVSDNPEFNVLPPSGVITGGGSKRFYILYDPITIGVKHAHVVFTHDAFTIRDSVTLLTVATVPRVKLSLTITAPSSGGNIPDGVRGISSAMSTRTLSWGVRAGASQGIWGADSMATAIDSAEGEFELPPVLAGMFDVRFAELRPGEHHFGNGSTVDMLDLMSPTQIDSYVVAVQPGPAGYPVTFHWSKASVSAAYTGAATLYTTLGSVDMKSIDSLQISSSAISSVLIVTSGPNLPILYGEGWNMASVSVDVGDPRKQVLFPTSTSAAVHFSEVGGYEERDTLLPGEGYWLKFPGLLHSVSFSGGIRLRDTIPVTSDWNMVGSLSVPVPAGSVQTIPPGIITGSIFDYAQGYTLADSLRPFRSYWVKTTQPGLLVLVSSGFGGLAKPAAMRAEMFGPEMATVTVRDAMQRQQTLYFAPSGKNLDMRNYDLPPQPPRGAFDARFASQRILEAMGGERLKDFPITISSPYYPVSVSWNWRMEGLTASLRVQGKDVPLTPQGSLQLTLPTENATGSAVTLSVRSGPALPQSFVVEQNYPNPFNPSTQITYDLPEDAHVTIKVFNLLGQEVQLLLDGRETAGLKVVRFDGAGLPSGVYFYRVTFQTVGTQQQPAGVVFSSTRKMMLLK